MQKLRLISFKLCPFVQRTIIVLLEKAVKHEIEYIDLNCKPDWFLKLSPMAKVPILQILEDDRVLFESSVICEYIDEISPGSLHPDDSFEKARHRAWIEFASALLDKIYTLYATKEKKIFDEKKISIGIDLERVENEIRCPLFSGDRFFMVDAAYASLFLFLEAFKSKYNLDFLLPFSKLSEWSRCLLSRESVKNCAPSDFPERLEKDIERLQSYLASLKSS